MSVATIALPDRPLTIAPDAIAPPRGRVLTIIVLLALAIGLAVWQAPGLVRDWRISRSPMVLPQGQVLDGECDTYRGFFTDCSARLTYFFKERNWTSDVSIVFVDFHSGDYQVDLVVSSEHPELATFSLALEKLWNRTITFAVIILLTAGGAVAVMLQWRRAAKAARALRDPARLSVVPAQITQTQKARGVTWITYQHQPPGGRKQTALTRFPDPASPLLVGGLPVAVLHPATPVPVLLDQELRRIDLTETERAGILSALPPAPPTAPATARGSVGRRLWRALVAVIVMLILIALAAAGYWLWYVTTSANSHDAIGMQINAVMPEPINAWGCAQLEARFDKGPAPQGCTGPGNIGWR